MTELTLSRKEGQTWRDAAIAQGRKYGLGEEVAAMFDDLLANGLSHKKAAREACIEWDVLERDDG